MQDDRSAWLMEEFRTATPERRKEMFNEAAASFHRDFDRDIELVCEGLVYIPHNCGVDNGPSGTFKTSGPFFCHLYYPSSNGTATSQYFLVDGLQFLKRAVDPVNPLKLVHQYSYGTPDGASNGLFHDGHSFIKWICNFMPQLETYVMGVAKSKSAENIRDLPVGKREGMAAVVTLGEILVPAWSLNDRLQNLSFMLYELGRGMITASHLAEAPVVPAHPGADERLRGWKNQVNVARGRHMMNLPSA